MLSEFDVWQMALYAGVTAFLVLLFVLVPPIIWPHIITFPWEKPPKQWHQTVIFAASYNPPHNGHLAMLQYLSTRYTKVIAVVGFNPDKKYLVSPDERAELLREMLKSANVTNIQVEVVEGYIWRYAKRVGATLFFRGIRSWEKDGRDERALQILNTWGPILLGPLYIPIPTIYIEGDPKYNHVSSTLIRQICSESAGKSQQEEQVNSLSELVPKNVAAKVAKLYYQQRKQ